MGIHEDRNVKPKLDTVKSVGPLFNEGKLLDRLGDPGEWNVVVQFLLCPQELTRQNSFVFRVLLWIVMVCFTFDLFVGRGDAWIVHFLHSLNLAVHESGHIIFGFGSRMLMSVGGSLFQCLMPLVFCLVLWIKQRDLLGASVALWWCFENVMDCVPYIADALPMRLTLINGVSGAESEYGFHDWNYILSEMGLLIKCDYVANAACAIALFGAVLCCLWGGWSLFYYLKFQKN